MRDNSFKTPVLFLIFNRLETSKAVFSQIKKVRPSKLYIASDGPRLNVAGEKELVDRIRKDIVLDIDWVCEIKTLFRQKNLGCKIAVSNAIDWFFENEDQGIILEDDCLPNTSFFKFCDELLEKYYDTESVALISGDNFHFGHKYGDADYFFSRIPHIWGWATWKRVWKKYDVSMSNYEIFKKSEKIKNIWGDKKIQKYWIDVFNDVVDNKIDTWDYQLAEMIFDRDMICVCPNKNLVTNIGFGAQGTHTVKKNRYTGISNQTINFPLRHPEGFIISEQADLNIVKNWFLKGYKIKKLLKRLRIFNLIKKIYSKFN